MSRDLAETTRKRGEASGCGECRESGIAIRGTSLLERSIGLRCLYYRLRRFGHACETSKTRERGSDHLWGHAGVRAERINLRAKIP
jgi:hypothetical protein